MTASCNPSTARTTSRLTPRLLAALAAVVPVVLTMLVPVNPTAAADHSNDQRGQRDLARVRQATARYHDLDVAVADSYQHGYRGIITGCIENPTAGAMGYHYFNWGLIEDLEVDPLRPEGLVYEPTNSGGLKLVAVEWVVPQARTDRPGVTSAPSVLGQELHILNPALGWYTQHAWIWDHNPAGIYTDWNPEIDCPDRSGTPPPTNP